MPVVLLVDDEALFRQSVRDALEARDSSLQVIEAENGAEALRAFDAQAVDLLITDVRMPEMDGIQLLVALSQRQEFVPTLVVSAHGGADTRTLARSFGALAFVDKPVDLDALVESAMSRLGQSASDTLRGVSLAGFLQLLSMEQRTCSIHVVSGPRSGSFSMIKGELVDAVVPKLRGDEAALLMARWPSPALHVESIMELTEQSMKMPLSHLLMEAARLEDEGAELDDESNPSWCAPLSERVKSNLVLGESMSNIKECLNEAMSLDGAIAAALVDFESGLTLGTAGGGADFDIDVAASGNTTLVRSKMVVMSQLGLNEGIEDILITLESQYHLIRPLATAPTLFFYLAIDRTRGNLGLARHRLKAIETKVVV